MKKKYFYLVIILLFLIGICFWEEYSVRVSLQTVGEMTSEIQTIVADEETINSYEILMLIENIDDFWHENEKNLCVLVNHNDIDDIGVEIARLKSNITTNQVEDFNASLSLIRFYVNNYRHFMGSSIQNLL